MRANLVVCVAVLAISCWADMYASMTDSPIAPTAVSNDSNDNTQNLRAEAERLYVEGKFEASFTLFESLYEQGDTISGLRLALSYIRGTGCNRDVDKGVEILEKFADEGCIAAYPHLCRVYMLVFQDNQKALEYARKSAKNDHGKMLNYMAWYLAPQDPDMAYACAQESADLGCDEGIRCLANFYVGGVGCERDLNKAGELFGKIADYNGSGRDGYIAVLIAQNKHKELYENLLKYIHCTDGDGENGSHTPYYLSYMYRNGIYVEKDMDKALFYGELSAERGDLVSQIELWRYYREKKDYIRMFKWLKKAAEQGDSASQAMLAHAYFFGEGCEINHDYGEKWACKASENPTDELISLLTELRIRRELGDERSELLINLIEARTRSYAP